jgi:mannose-6-phosphate isomerase-like protein (cupin superfamily)
MYISTTPAAPPPSSSPRRTLALRLGWRLAAITGLLGAGAFLGVAVFGFAVARAVAPPPAYTLQNAVKAFSMDGIEKTKVGYQYWFFDKEFAQGRTIKLSVVGPHLASHPPHQHDGNEFFFILEGSAEFFLDGKTRVVGPQTGMYAAPQSLHGIKNVGDGELKYLVIKDYPWPPQPEEKPKAVSAGK